MNILSIKGGGCRGLIPLIFLKEFEKRTQKSIHELFHYFGGCSVGSLIISSLLISDDIIKNNAKYTAHQSYDLFLKHAKTSFSWTYYSYITSMFGLIGPKYTSCGLFNIVNESCQDHTMNKLLKPVIFPAYDRIRNKPFYFDKELHANVKISDCIMATTSIPTYFESHKVNIDDQLHDFLDSAMVTNDASQLVLLKSLSTMYVDKKNIFLLSLGTGIYPNTIHSRNGLLGWIPYIVNTLITGAEENEMYQLSLALPKENYCILDIPLDQAYSPDDTSDKTIEYYIKTTEKWIEEHDDIMTMVCQKLLQHI
ncbi:MAG TPA: patatin-like phospholipase family protein [Candidatus Saccharimonadales bacterium]|nr:patatin-like phospholipase family protein [Candidatus Saccharimonadales bacterium]